MVSFSECKHHRCKCDSSGRMRMFEEGFCFRRRFYFRCWWSFAAFVIPVMDVSREHHFFQRHSGMGEIRPHSACFATLSFFSTILGFVMSGSYLPGNGRHHHHVQGLLPFEALLLSTTVSNPSSLS
ncbi:hypothetical protein NC653_032813 [Populus alba x Populus x berolinensis]|uniref:Uncharacterized protein n=1 Tax=Populus alba x Populus x berolinensis TaxID=444605 RepID=A0AAD6LSH8_9ROSI|nr:hypothetical protein NC653_032813 [Populus alba x Populus x berolinensis]